MINSSDLIRCSLVQFGEYNTTKFLYTRSDNTVLTNEEIDKIDIGQEEWKYQMPTGLKTWKFIDHTPDMRAKEQKIAFIAAFRSIEKLTKLRFDYIHDLNNLNFDTDITIEWKEDIETFDNKLTVLAHAYLYVPGSTKNGVMEFNDSVNSKYHFTPLGEPLEANLIDPNNYTPGQKDAISGNLIKLKTQPALHIGMHEIGHLLGLRHDLNETNAIMYPYVQKGYINGKVNKNAFTWQKSDVKRLEKYFGKSNILPSRLRRWQARRVMQSIYNRK